MPVPVLTPAVPAGAAAAGRGVRGAPPAGPLRAAAPRVLRAVRHRHAAPPVPQQEGEPRRDPPPSLSLLLLSLYLSVSLSVCPSCSAFSSPAGPCPLPVLCAHRVEPRCSSGSGRGEAPRSLNRERGNCVRGWEHVSLWAANEWFLRQFLSSTLCS